MSLELDALRLHNPMQGFKLDNEQVFKSLHESLFVPVGLYARKLISDRATADDIVSDAFIKLWEQRDQFDSIVRVKQFLFTATKNACLNHMRNIQLHAKIHQKIAYATASVSDNYIEFSTIRGDLTQLLWRELDRLPPARKQVCTLLLKERLTVSEIAARLSISPQSVDTHIKRATKQLKAAFLQRKIIHLLIIFFNFLS